MNTVSKSALRVGLVALVVASLAGCVSSSDSPDQDNTPTVGTQNDTRAQVTFDRADGRILATNTSGSGMDAQILGTITLDKGGCWALTGDGEQSSTITVWPPDTTQDDQTLRAPDLARPLSVGDHIMAGGGEVAADTYPAVVDACGASGKIFVLASFVSVD